MTLSPRLLAIGELVLPGSRVADVGTDHGHLPVWLIRTKRSPFVIATDLRIGPLNAARHSARRYAVEDEIDFRLADGLSAVSPHEVDTVVIAGMGGETIIQILEGSSWLRHGKYRLLLQPQSKIPQVLDFLPREGFLALDQHLVEDSGIIYTIFTVVPGEMEPQTGGCRYILPALLRRRDPLLPAYLESLERKLGQAADGLTRATGIEAAKKRQELNMALADFKNWRDGNSEGYEGK